MEPSKANRKQEHKNISEQENFPRLGTPSTKGVRGNIRAQHGKFLDDKKIDRDIAWRKRHPLP